jgi:hypothetical protein
MNAEHRLGEPLPGFRLAGMSTSVIPAGAQR